MIELNAGDVDGRPHRVEDYHCFLISSLPHFPVTSFPVSFPIPPFIATPSGAYYSRSGFVRSRDRTFYLPVKILGTGHEDPCWQKVKGGMHASPGHHIQDGT